jgi:hypothetical protein
MGDHQSLCTIISISELIKYNRIARMSESSKFFRTSYKKGPQTSFRLTGRSGSFQKTTDTEHNFEKTVSQFGLTRNRGFTSRLSHTSGQLTGRADKTTQPSDFGITVCKPVAATDYSKRKIDPFVLSSKIQGDDFVEFTERSSGQKKPYVIGTRNFSHGEIVNGSVSQSRLDFGRVNTEPQELNFAQHQKYFSAQQNSSKKIQPNTIISYVKPAQSSDLLMKGKASRKTKNLHDVDRQ